MKLLIKNGTVINPGDRKITKADVLVTDGVISKVAPGLKDTADETYDAKGCYVMPGFIDLHVHLRDPGLEYWRRCCTAWWIYDHRGNAEHKTGGR